MLANLNCLLIGTELYDYEFFCEALKAKYPNAKCDFTRHIDDAIARLQRQLIEAPDYIFINWNLPDADIEVGVCRLRSIDKIKHCPLVILAEVPSFTEGYRFEAIGIERVISLQTSINELSDELYALMK